MLIPKRMLVAWRRLRYSGPGLMQRYLLWQFLSILLLCLFAATSLFLVFELFERIRIFVENDSSLLQVIQYLGYKIPLIIQLMMPVAVLIATLISVGRLSQLSEITAMRACGASVFSLSKPLLGAGLAISAIMFITGETLVPWATQRVDELYHLDIKKKDITGTFSKSDFWYRQNNKFYSVHYYDSRNASLSSFSVFEVNDKFALSRILDAREAKWQGNPLVGWTMRDVVESTPSKSGRFDVTSFSQLPLVIKETPRDFFNMEVTPETLSYGDLKRYIEKLTSEGVPTTKYLIDLSSKISFPLVNFIVVLVAFPFALIPARSGTLTMSFVAGISIGFTYHVVHALCTSLGAAELLPILPAAWAANILLGCVGGYFMAGAEH